LALKQAGEKSPFGSDERKIYSTKANSLREILKTQFGMTNIDADYGPTVPLASTPGGGKIDWNILANAADVLGTSQAGSTRSAFDRALGEYLTRNLPVWQKQQATSPSSSITSTTSNVMGGGGAAQSIIGGQPLTASPVNSGMQASQATATQGAKRAGTWDMGTAGGIEPTALTPTGQGAGMGTGTNVYGDFIKSEYFKNNDYEGYFISKTPNIPTIQGDDGKMHIDWANPNMPANMYTLYGNGVGFWNTAQGLSKEQNTFNATEIEKNPAFIEQNKVFTAEMELLLKQNGLSVDAQLAGLKGSQDANKAALEYELNTIRREIGASNWRSRQSLAASGMAFSGMLGYLYGQNEAKGMDATIRATAISAAEIKAIGEQMAILEGSKLSYASDLEGLYGAKRAAYRASLLDPQNARYTEVGQLLDDAIAGLEGTTAMATPSLAMGQRADVAAAQTANYEMVKEVAKLGKQGIWLSQDPNGNWTWKTGLTDAEQTTRDSALFDQWYKTEGLNLDWAAQDLSVAKQKFAEWATTQGLNLDKAKLDLEWAQLVETNRHNVVGEGISQQNANTSAAGSSGTDAEGNPIYDPKGDLSILSNSGATAAEKQRAALNLTAGKGALTDANFSSFMQGGRMATDANGNVKFLSPTEKLPRGFTETGTVSGLLTLDTSQALQVANLIEDPVRQMAVMVILSMKGKAGDPAKSWFDPMNQLIADNADQYEFSSEEVGQLEKILLTYFGTQPGPGE
jgi:hypothetical protein